LQGSRASSGRRPKCRNSHPWTLCAVWVQVDHFQAPLIHMARAPRGLDRLGRHNTTTPSTTPSSVSGLVVKSIVAIDGPRVRFAADAAHSFCCPGRPFDVAAWVPTIILGCPGLLVVLSSFYGLRSCGGINNALLVIRNGATLHRKSMLRQYLSPAIARMEDFKALSVCCPTLLGSHQGCR
jgi:hypothetical protein